MAFKERLIKKSVKAELAEKETIIRVLTTHIREKELL